ncbi:MAG TPA: hypothetical protein VIF62_24810 [Labilithrix sp.]
MKNSLAGVTTAERVDVFATVASEELVTSPFTGRRAAAIVVDLFERVAPLEHEVGRAILGDTLVLDADGGALVVVARRASFAFVSDGETGALGGAPAELAFLLARAKGRGPLVWREHLVARGMRLRVRGLVTPSSAGRFTCDALAIVEPVLT